MAIDNRKKLTNDPELDVKELEGLESTVSKICQGMEMIFVMHAMKDPKNMRHAATAAIYAPLSFAFNIMRVTDASGVKPKEMYPTFVKVYANIARNLGKLEEDYHKLPWKEFEQKYAELYTAENHFAYDLDDYKKE